MCDLLSGGRSFEALKGPFWTRSLHAQPSALRLPVMHPARLSEPSWSERHPAPRSPAMAILMSPIVACSARAVSGNHVQEVDAEERNIELLQRGIVT